MDKAKTIDKCLQACADWGLIPTEFRQCMTWEEQVLWLEKFLKDTVIPTFNENTEAYNELKTTVENFFATLDVQEEINNKLDDMADSGELADIISQYLNSTAIFGYDNVASMKAAENLIDGSYARTLGYYTKNDGGGALYKIRNITNDDVVDEVFIIEMGDASNQLVAELIIENNTINIKQAGAKTDADFDNSTLINLCLSKCNTVIVPEGEFPINNSVIIPSNTSLIGTNENESVIKAIADKSFDLIQLNNNEYATLKDICIDGDIYIGDSPSPTDYSINGITLDYTDSIDSFNRIENVEVKNCTNNGIFIKKQKEGIFKNISIHNCGCGINIKSTDSKFTDITSYWNNIVSINGSDTLGHGIYIQQNSNSNKFVNCKAHSNHGIGVLCRGSYNNITNLEAQDNLKHGIELYNCNDNNLVAITSSTNSQESNTYNEIYLEGVKDCYIQGNTVTRDVSWTNYYAPYQLKLTENCFNNIIVLNYTLNPAKLSGAMYMVGATCYNDITINNAKYGIKNLADEYLLSDTKNGNGVSNVFDEKTVDSNDGTLVINTTKGCQTINYASAQKTSPNGWLGASVMIEDGFQIGNYVNAIANFKNSNVAKLPVAIEARFYDDQDAQLSQQRAWGDDNQIKFTKVIPASTAKIRLSFIVLSNELGASGTVDLYSFKYGITM